MLHLTRVMKKTALGVSDINRAVQPQRMARGLERRQIINYLVIENLRNLSVCVVAQLICVCFSNTQKQVFS